MIELLKLIGFAMLAFTIIGIGGVCIGALSFAESEETDLSGLASKYFKEKKEGILKRFKANPDGMFKK